MEVRRTLKEKNKRMENTIHILMVIILFLGIMIIILLFNPIKSEAQYKLGYSDGANDVKDFCIDECLLAIEKIKLIKDIECKAKMNETIYLDPIINWRDFG